MLTRGVRVRVVVFVVIAVVAVVYTGARYAGLDRLFGGSGYTVVVQLPDSGGIFTNAEVTYRGVAVGRVGQLRLRRGGGGGGVQMGSSGPPIPSGPKGGGGGR